MSHRCPNKVGGIGGPPCRLEMAHVGACAPPLGHRSWRMAALVAIVLLLAGCSGADEAEEEPCQSYVYYNHTNMWSDDWDADPAGRCYVDTEPGTPYGGAA